jgi:uncharacterized protein YrzB (UPF0473 family)
MSSQEGSFWVDEDNRELVLEDPEGEERFYIDEEFNYEGKTYLVLIPAEDGEYDENEALLLKLVKEEGSEMLSMIEDDDEFEKAKEYYMDKE